jgi:hypothetical protein
MNAPDQRDVSAFSTRLAGGVNSRLIRKLSVERRLSKPIVLKKSGLAGQRPILRNNDSSEERDYSR